VVLSPLLINHTHKFNVLPTDLKTEAVHCRGQGQGSSRPRPGVFEAKAAKFCPRAVLEVKASPRGPHPCFTAFVSFAFSVFGDT